MKVAEKPRPWVSRNGKPLAGGVSSFGFSGTNAHIILQEAPPAPVRGARSQRGSHTFTLSAASSNALKHMAQQHLDLMNQDSCPNFEDVCNTLNVGRVHMRFRLAAFGKDVSEIKSALAAFKGDSSRANLCSNILVDSMEPQVAFVFPDEGSQFVGMATELYESQPVFKQSMDECAGLMKNHLDAGLMDIISSSKINDSKYGQAALFAIEYPLAKLWEAWGVKPSMLMGEGVGEIVAAVVGNCLSMEDACVLVCARADALASKSSSGFAAFGKTVQKIKFRESKLDNFPASRGKCKNKVSSSHWTKQIAAKQSKAAASVSAIETAGCSLFLVLGSTSSVNLVTDSKVLACVGRSNASDALLSEALASLYCSGVNIGFEAVNKPFGFRRVPLPTYPFQRQKHWIPNFREAKEAAASRKGKVTAQQVALDKALTTRISALVGQRVQSPFVNDKLFISQMSCADQPTIADHVINNFTIVPAVYYVTFILEAARNIFGAGPRVLSKVAIPSAILLKTKTDSKPTQLHLVPGKGKNAKYTWTLYSLKSGEPDDKESWTVNALGLVEANPKLTELPPPVHEPVSVIQRA